MAAERIEFQLVVNAQGGVQVLDKHGEAAKKARQQAQQLARAEAALAAELDGVRTALRSATKAYREAGQGQDKFRKEALANAGALTEQRNALQVQLKALRDQQAALGQSASSYQRGGQAATSLGYAIEDLAVSSGGLANRLRGVANNLPQLVQGLSSARRSGAGLVGILSGPGGMILAISTLSALAITFAPKLEQLFAGAAAKAKEAREETEGLYDELVRFEGTDFELGVVFPDAPSQRDNVRGLIGLVRETKDEIADYNRIVEEGTEVFVNPKTGSAELIYTEEAERAREAVADLEETLARRETLLEDARKNQEDRTKALENQRDVLAAGGGVDAETFRQQQEQQREQERERERAEKEAAAAAEKRAKERRERLLAAEELLADLRIETIEDAREREIAAAEAAFRERVDIAGENLAALALAEEAFAQQRAAINARFAQAAIDAQREFNEAARELEEERRVLTGESEAAILQTRLDGVDAQLATLEEGTEAWREAYLEREGIARDLTKAVQKELDAMTDANVRAGNEVLREQQRQFDEAQREFERRLRLYERFALGALDALDAGFRAERRYTDAQIALQRDRFAQEEAALRESLENREISRREYELQVRALREETAAFEDAVREDQLSKTQRALLTLTGFLKEQAIEQVKLALATAAAEAVESVFRGPIPFPLNLAAAAGAITAVAGLESLIRGIGGFASGGYTGDGQRLEPAGVVHRGEFVLTKQATAGNVDDLYWLMALLERGHNLRGLLGGAGYASGGFVEAARPAAPSPRSSTPVAPTGEPSVGGDGGVQRAILAELQRLNETVPRAVGNPHAARRLRHLAERQDALTSPRGGVLSR